MSRDVNVVQDEELETNPSEQPSDPQEEEALIEQPQEKVDDDTPIEAEDIEEVVVSFGDEEIPKDEEHNAPAWVKDVRRKNRELKKQLREAKNELSSLQAPKEVEVGEKPNIDDFDYDTDAYSDALMAWNDRKIEAEAKQKSAQKLQDEQAREWQSKLDDYNNKKSDLKLPDFEDAESTVVDKFTQTQTGIILQGADNPALLIYALGKNDQRAKELAGIKDPVKFAFKVAKLEKDLKMTKRKAPPPEKPLRGGSANLPGTSDRKLIALQEKARESGDFTKVIEYRRQLKRKE